MFGDHPGFIYVIATLLPLASFVLLLLAGAVRAAARRYRDSSGAAETLYGWLGGDVPAVWPAYVATGAIGLAFVCTLIGFIQFKGDQAKIPSHHEAAAHTHEHEHGKKHAEDKKEHEHAKAVADPMEQHWSDRKTFAEIAPSGILDSQRATRLEIGYRIDNLSGLMFLMVTFIATLIHVFSIGYMSDERQPIVEDHQVHTAEGHLHRRGRFGRFFMFLSLFCFSMLNLVLADNLFQIFISWELVGVCSYLLIGFYYERRSASNAANKAFIVNRVGDAGLIIGLLILWTYLGTFNFQDIFQQIRAPVTDSDGDPLQLSGQVVRGNVVRDHGDEASLEITRSEGQQVVLFPREPEHFHKDSLAPGAIRQVTNNPGAHDFGTMPYWLLVVAGLGIFTGCVGKSAQFPLHVWLPDAMEGPTPVSALIHAATMVAAGVYLVGRVYPLFTPESRLVIAYTGGITLFVAATIAVVMTNIKKVLAYSTVSQLGYMMLALGIGGWVAGLFHLLTHAFFKALLFLCSGSVIYGCHHEQEMTKMGGLFPKMKTTALTMLMGVLAICGTPLFTGWYSKDMILAQALGFMRVHPEHGLLFFLPLVTAGITAFYMFRMWFMTFTGPPRDERVHEHAHESPRTMTVPLVLLAVCSVCVAWGWPLWNAEASLMGSELHHAQPVAVLADFGGPLGELNELWEGTGGAAEASERYWALEYHQVAEALALGVGLVGILFAFLLYYMRWMDPAEAAEQVPALHRFLLNKWYFDELYSVLLVRPALAVAHWARSFDLWAIDGTLHGTAEATVRVSRWSGKFDLNIIDGLVNLTGDVIYAIGGRLRTLQTGYLRNYVLFLVLAAIAIFAVLSWVVVALAG